MLHSILKFEWDENKCASNLKKHGFDFREAVAIWQGPVREFASSQMHHGEHRMVGVGIADGRSTAVIFVWRGEARRIISARPTRTYEREDYDLHFG